MSLKNHEYYMEQALAKTKEGIEKDQAPFGACIVKDGEIVALEHNVVKMTTDITAHAEIHAIRQACKKLNTIDLSGSTIYSTCEPCPMCFTACHWARIDTIVFGAYTKDAFKAGFNELVISDEKLKELGESSIELIPEVMYHECKELFDIWLSNPNKALY
jgi:tRNA(Arg) A34 adenosine deaminase TadA